MRDLAGSGPVTAPVYCVAFSFCGSVERIANAVASSGVRLSPVSVTIHPAGKQRRTSVKALPGGAATAHNSVVPFPLAATIWIVSMPRICALNLRPQYLIAPYARDPRCNVAAISP
jgi:hypothetical protein